MRKDKLLLLTLMISLLGYVSAETITHTIKENKFNNLIESEYEYDSVVEAFNDMFDIDDKEIKLKTLEKSKSYEIASGEELKKYLENNNIDFIYIDGKGFSKTGEKIEIPYEMYENDIFYLIENDSFQTSASNTNYVILPYTYDDLESYDIYKFVGINHNFYDDGTYTEKYYLSKK